MDASSLCLCGVIKPSVRLRRRRRDEGAGDVRGAANTLADLANNNLGPEARMSARCPGAGLHLDATGRSTEGFNPDPRSLPPAEGAPRSR